MKFIRLKSYLKFFRASHHGYRASGARCPMAGPSAERENCALRAILAVRPYRAFSRGRRALRFVFRRGRRGQRCAPVGPRVNGPTVIEVQDADVRGAQRCTPRRYVMESFRLGPRLG